MLNHLDHVVARYAVCAADFANRHEAVRMGAEVKEEPKRIIGELSELHALIICM
jgi:hypothetical protein